MNLHAIVSGVIASVNPLIAMTVQISTGNVIAADGTRVPTYATPGAFTASITGTALTVSAVAQGALMVGQTIAGAGVAANTMIVAFGTGAGGIGTYEIAPSQTISSEDMTTTLTVVGQVQPLSYSDIQHMDALNIQGTRRAIYMNGAVDGLVRVNNKGGDLITISSGVNAGVWLVAMISEAWPDWCKAIVTLQDGA